MRRLFTWIMALGLVSAAVITTSHVHQSVAARSIQSTCVYCHLSPAPGLEVTPEVSLEIPTATDFWSEYPKPLVSTHIIHVLDVSPKQSPPA